MAELVTDYLEQALPLRTRLAVRFHLAICSACTHYFDQVRRTVALLRSRPLPPPPGTTTEAILQRLDDPPTTP